jgi:hypothetical protein
LPRLQASHEARQMCGSCVGLTLGAVWPLVRPLTFTLARLSGKPSMSKPLALSVAQYAKIAEAGNLPPNRAKELRRLLSEEVARFKFQSSTYRAAAEGREIATALNVIFKSLNKALVAIDRHPVIRQRLAGIALFDKRLGKRTQIEKTREVVDLSIDHVVWIGQLALWSYQLGGTGREVERNQTGSDDPPKAVFTSSLMWIWRFKLGRDLTNWGREERDDDRGSPLTRFVQACFEAAGHSDTILAARQRIRRVKKRMDANEAAGRLWLVMNPQGTSARRRIKLVPRQ